MIEIKKSNPPSELVKLQKDAVDEGLTANEAYNKLSSDLKKQVKKQLMQDQGYLCAYCMRRIPDKRDVERGISNSLESRIEHWIPRSDSNCGAFGALDYNNLLAVCSGNENDSSRGKSKLTCDARRRDRKLTVNPLDASTLVTVYYTEDGIIKAFDNIIDDDLNVRLNLNCTKDAVMLPLERKKVLDVIQKEVQTEVESGKSLLEICKQLYQELLEIDGEKPPYIGISLWWLKNTIESLENDT